MTDEATIYSKDTGREQRLPPDQALTDKWPVLQFGEVYDIDSANWTLTVFGLVETERRLTFADFCALPRIKVHSDIHCVTGWTRLDNRWEGVGTVAIRDLVSIRPEARFVVVHGAGGFTTNLTLDDFFSPDVLFAMKHDGHQLTAGHGYPVRLVVPLLYFWKSTKWVTGVEFTAEERLGYWETHGYHRRGDPWLEERYNE